MVDGTAPTVTPQRGYQVKTVSFAAHQTHHIREVYRQPLGTIALWGDDGNRGTPAFQAFVYIFSTGATWKGNIGRATMSITFAKDARVRSPLRVGEPPDADQTTETGAKKLWKWWTGHPHTIEGAEDFHIHGRTLELVKRNWKPTADDDENLYFGYYHRR